MGPFTSKAMMSGSAPEEPVDAETAPDSGPATAVPADEKTTIEPVSEAVETEDGEEEITLEEWVEQEDQLVKEAAEALPRKFDECSFDQGYVRQAIYVCQTCTKDGQPAGICYSCSISCHTDHDLLELNNKRHFRCDCGGSRFDSPCTLKEKEKDTETNPENNYGRNFKDEYCLCGEATKTGSESMFQCLVCEDWYHDICLGKTPETETFEDFICRLCIDKNTFLKRYAALPSFIALPVTTSTEPAGSAGPTPTKRPRTDEAGSETASPSGAKKPRMVSSQNSPRRDVERSPAPASDAERPRPEVGEGGCKWRTLPDNEGAASMDIYGKAGWRDEICGCKECRDLYYVKDLVFLKEPEELYEPPLDDEANESLEDITLRKLNSMPRDKAIEAVNAYNKIKEDLQNFLQQAAKKGKVITPEDVHEFFGVRTAALQKKSQDRDVFF